MTTKLRFEKYSTFWGRNSQQTTFEGKILKRRLWREKFSEHSSLLNSLHQTSVHLPFERFLNDHKVVASWNSPKIHSLRRRLVFSEDLRSCQKSMGWLRLVGSLKMVGLFCKRALQKRPIFSEDLRSCQRSRVLSKIFGVATISRLLKIIGLFCKRALQKRPIFSKETYHFKEPTHRSHPIQSLENILWRRLCGHACALRWCTKILNANSSKRAVSTMWPLTEEIRLKICGSPDFTDSL